MKKLVAVVVASLSVFTLLASCAPTVAKTEYDKTLGELSTLQTQNTQIQTDLTAALALSRQLQTEIAKKETQFQSDLAKKDGQLQAANDRIKQAAIRIEILNALFLPVMTGKQMTTSQQLDIVTAMREKVKATGDVQLIAKLDAFFEAAARQAQNPSDANLLAANTAVRDFYAYLLATLPKTLQDGSF